MDDPLDPTWLIDLPTIAGPSRDPIEQNAEMARSCRERRHDPVLSPHDGHVAVPFDAEM